VLAWLTICLERGADLHIVQVMPLPLTVSCFSKIQIGFTFLVPADLSSPGQRAVKRVCVCVCVCVCAADGATRSVRSSTAFLGCSPGEVGTRLPVQPVYVRVKASERSEAPSAGPLLQQAIPLSLLCRRAVLQAAVRPRTTHGKGQSRELFPVQVFLLCS